MESASRSSTRTRTCSPGPPSPTRARCILGYMYAADPSLRTARTMMAGALAFAPFLRRHLGRDVRASPPRGLLRTPSTATASTAPTRSPATWPRSTTSWPTAASAPGAAYLGGDVLAPLRRWSTAEVTEQLDPEHAVAVVRQPRGGHRPGRARRDAASSDRRRAARSRCAPGTAVESRSSATVDERVRGRGHHRRGRVGGDLRPGGQRLVGRRIAVDETLGLRPADPGCTGSSTASACGGPTGSRRRRASTVISGPFGEVVSYPDQTTYLTWYPACVLGYSTSVSPPRTWKTCRPSRDARRSCRAPSTASPGWCRVAGGLREDELAPAVVKGGRHRGVGRDRHRRPERASCTDGSPSG